MLDWFLPIASEVPAINLATLRRRTECSRDIQMIEKSEVGSRAGFEPATFRLTAEMIKNLSALSGVAYEKLGAIFPSLVAPTPAPTAAADEKAISGPPAQEASS